MKKGRELYNDGQLRVEFWPEGEGHKLFIGDDEYIIPRGILQEAARTPRRDLRGKLELLDPAIMVVARESGIHVDGIGMALAQARVEELDRELGAAYSGR